MPSRPHSEHVALMRDAILMTSEEVDTVALLSNTRREPNFPTTNQRLESPGACVM